MSLSPEFVRLLTLDSRGEAETLAAVLAANGFQTHVRDAPLLGGSAAVLVDRQDAVEAAEFLRDRLDRADSLDNADRCLACDAMFPDQGDHCPECGWSYAEA